MMRFNVLLALLLCVHSAPTITSTVYATSVKISVAATDDNPVSCTIKEGAGAPSAATELDNCKPVDGTCGTCLLSYDKLKPATAYTITCGVTTATITTKTLNVVVRPEEIRSTFVKAQVIFDDFHMEGVAIDVACKAGPGTHVEECTKQTEDIDDIAGFFTYECDLRSDATDEDPLTPDTAYTISCDYKVKDGDTTLASGTQTYQVRTAAAMECHWTDISEGAMQPKLHSLVPGNENNWSELTNISLDVCAMTCRRFSDYCIAYKHQASESDEDAGTCYLAHWRKSTFAHPSYGPYTSCVALEESQVEVQNSWVCVPDECQALDDDKLSFVVADICEWVDAPNNKYFNLATEGTYAPVVGVTTAANCEKHCKDTFPYCQAYYFANNACKALSIDGDRVNYYIKGDCVNEPITQQGTDKAGMWKCKCAELSHIEVITPSHYSDAIVVAGQWKDGVGFGKDLECIAKPKPRPDFHVDYDFGISDGQGSEFENSDLGTGVVYGLWPGQFGVEYVIWCAWEHDTGSHTDISATPPELPPFSLIARTAPLNWHQYPTVVQLESEVIIIVASPNTYGPHDVQCSIQKAADLELDHAWQSRTECENDDPPEFNESDQCNMDSTCQFTFEELDPNTEYNIICRIHFNSMEDVRKKKGKKQDDAEPELNPGALQYFVDSQTLYELRVTTEPNPVSPPTPPTVARTPTGLTQATPTCSGKVPVTITSTGNTEPLKCWVVEDFPAAATAIEGAPEYTISAPNLADNTHTFQVNTPATLKAADAKVKLVCARVPDGGATRKTLEVNGIALSFDLTPTSKKYALHVGVVVDDNLCEGSSPDEETYRIACVATDSDKKLAFGNTVGRNIGVMCTVGDDGEGGCEDAAFFFSNAERESTGAGGACAWTTGTWDVEYIALAAAGTSAACEAACKATTEPTACTAWAYTSVGGCKLGAFQLGMIDTEEDCDNLDVSELTAGQTGEVLQCPCETGIEIVAGTNYQVECVLGNPEAGVTVYKNVHYQPMKSTLTATATKLGRTALTVTSTASSHGVYTCRVEQPDSDPIMNSCESSTCIIDLVTSDDWIHNDNYCVEVSCFSNTDDPDFIESTEVDNDYVATHLDTLITLEPEIKVTSIDATGSATQIAVIVKANHYANVLINCQAYLPLSGEVESPVDLLEPLYAMGEELDDHHRCKATQCEFTIDELTPSKSYNVFCVLAEELYHEREDRDLVLAPAYAWKAAVATTALTFDDLAVTVSAGAIHVTTKLNSNAEVYCAASDVIDGEAFEDLIGRADTLDFFRAYDSQGEGSNLQVFSEDCTKDVACTFDIFLPLRTGTHFIPHHDYLITCFYQDDDDNYVIKSAIAEGPDSCPAGFFFCPTTPHSNPCVESCGSCGPLKFEDAGTKSCRGAATVAECNDEELFGYSTERAFCPNDRLLDNCRISESCWTCPGYPVDSQNDICAAATPVNLRSEFVGVSSAAVRLEMPIEDDYDCLGLVSCWAVEVADPLKIKIYGPPVECGHWDELENFACKNADDTKRRKECVAWVHHLKPETDYNLHCTKANGPPTATPLPVKTTGYDFWIIPGQISPHSISYRVGFNPPYETYEEVDKPFMLTRATSCLVKESTANAPTVEDIVKDESGWADVDDESEGVSDVFTVSGLAKPDTNYKIYCVFALNVKHEANFLFADATIWNSTIETYEIKTPVQDCTWRDIKQPSTQAARLDVAYTDATDIKTQADCELLCNKNECRSWNYNANTKKCSYQAIKGHLVEDVESFRCYDIRIDDAVYTVAKACLKEDYCDCKATWSTTNTAVKHYVSQHEEFIKIAAATTAAACEQQCKDAFPSCQSWWVAADGCRIQFGNIDNESFEPGDSCNAEVEDQATATAYGGWLCPCVSLSSVTATAVSPYKVKAKLAFSDGANHFATCNIYEEDSQAPKNQQPVTVMNEKSEITFDDLDPETEHTVKCEWNDVEKTGTTTTLSDDLTALAGVATHADAISWSLTFKDFLDGDQPIGVECELWEGDKETGEEVVIGERSTFIGATNNVNSYRFVGLKHTQKYTLECTKGDVTKQASATTLDVWKTAPTVDIAYADGVALKYGTNYYQPETTICALFATKAAADAITDFDALDAVEQTYSNNQCPDMCTMCLASDSTDNSLTAATTYYARCAVYDGDDASGFVTVTATTTAAPVLANNAIEIVNVFADKVYFTVSVTGKFTTGELVRVFCKVWAKEDEDKDSGNMFEYADEWRCGEHEDALRTTSKIIWNADVDEDIHLARQFTIVCSLTGSEDTPAEIVTKDFTAPALAFDELPEQVGSHFNKIVVAATPNTANNHNIRCAYIPAEWAANTLTTAYIEGEDGMEDDCMAGEAQESDDIDECEMQWFTDSSNAQCGWKRSNVANKKYNVTGSIEIASYDGETINNANACEAACKDLYNEETEAGCWAWKWKTVSGTDKCFINDRSNIDQLCFASEEVTDETGVKNAGVYLCTNCGVWPSANFKVGCIVEDWAESKEPVVINVKTGPVPKIIAGPTVTTLGRLAAEITLTTNVDAHVSCKKDEDRLNDGSDTDLEFECEANKPCTHEYEHEEEFDRPNPDTSDICTAELTCTVYQDEEQGFPSHLDFDKDSEKSVVAVAYKGYVDWDKEPKIVADHVSDTGFEVEAVVNRPNVYIDCVPIPALAGGAPLPDSDNSGGTACGADRNCKIAVGKLKSGAKYNVFCFLREAFGVRNDEDRNAIREVGFRAFSVTTESTALALSSVTVTPKPTALDISASLSVYAKVSCVAVEAGATAPTAADVKKNAGSAPCIKGASCTMSITGLLPSKNYDVYCIGKSVVDDYVTAVLAKTGQKTADPSNKAECQMVNAANLWCDTDKKCLAADGGCTTCAGKPITNAADKVCVSGASGNDCHAASSQEYCPEIPLCLPDKNCAACPGKITFDDTTHVCKKIELNGDKTVTVGIQMEGVTADEFNADQGLKDNVKKASAKIAFGSEDEKDNVQVGNAENTSSKKFDAQAGKIKVQITFLKLTEALKAVVASAMQAAVQNGNLVKALKDLGVTTLTIPENQTVESNNNNNNNNNNNTPSDESESEDDSAMGSYLSYFSLLFAFLSCMWFML